MPWVVCERLDPISPAKPAVTGGQRILLPSAYWRALGAKSGPTPLHQVLPLLRRAATDEAKTPTTLSATVSVGGGSQEGTQPCSNPGHMPYAHFKQWLAVIQQACSAAVRTTPAGGLAACAPDKPSTRVVDLTSLVPQRRARQVQPNTAQSAFRSPSPPRAGACVPSSGCSALSQASQQQQQQQTTKTAQTHSAKHQSQPLPASASGRRHQRVTHPSMYVDAQMHAAQLDECSSAAQRQQVTAALRDTAAVLQVLAHIAPDAATHLLSQLVECVAVLQTCPAGGISASASRLVPPAAAVCFMHGVLESSRIDDQHAAFCHERFCALQIAVLSFLAAQPGGYPDRDQGKLAPASALAEASLGNLQVGPRCAGSSACTEGCGFWHTPAYPAASAERTEAASGGSEAQQNIIACIEPLR